MSHGTLVLSVEDRRLVLSIPTPSPEGLATAHIADMNNPHTVTLEQARTAGDTFAGDVDMDGNTLKAVAAPVAGTDAANKDYVDTQVGPVWAKDVFNPSFNGQVSFILSRAPVQPDSFELSINTAEYDEGVDYTLSGTTLTWLDPFTLKTTDKLILQYK